MCYQQIEIMAIIQVEMWSICQVNLTVELETKVSKD